MRRTQRRSPDGSRVFHSGSTPSDWQTGNFSDAGRAFAFASISAQVITTRRPISVDGSLPNGATFVGPAGLKQALIEHRYDDLVRQTVSKMLAYALGRQLEYYDEPAVRDIIARLEADDLAEIGGTIFGFFMSPAQMKVIREMATG